MGKKQPCLISICRFLSLGTTRYIVISRNYIPSSLKKSIMFSQNLDYFSNTFLEVPHRDSEDKAIAFLLFCLASNAFPDIGSDGRIENKKTYKKITRSLGLGGLGTPG